MVQFGPENNGIIAALILYNSKSIRLCDEKNINTNFISVTEACLRLPEYIHLMDRLYKNQDFFDFLFSLQKIFQVFKIFNITIILE